MKQANFNAAKSEEEKAVALRLLAERSLELAQARYELARRDTADAFARVQSPSAMAY